MNELVKLIEANRNYTAPSNDGPRPKRRLAIVTCMDSRIDVFAALGLKINEAHIIRNAGGRVTEDVLRSLALSSHALGVTGVVVMQHTECGLLNKTNEALRELTGADLEFLPIHDHEATLRADIDKLRETPFLSTLEVLGGLVFDVETGDVREVVPGN